MTAFRRVVAVAVLALAGVALPAQAATGASLTGAAGTYRQLTVSAPITVGSQLKEFDDLVATRGDFVGVAIVDLAGNGITYQRGRSATRACVFGSPCDLWDIPQAWGSTRQDDGSYVLAPGAYRVALLGSPGATVTWRTRLPFVTGAMRTTTAGHLTVQALTSSYPATGTTQPKADGRASSAGDGVAVAGLVFRLDVALAKDATGSVCVSGEAVTLPTDQLGGCTMTASGGGTDMGYGIYFIECPAEGPPPPVAVCTPFGISPTSVSWGAAAVVRGDARVAYDMTTRAVKSHVSSLGYAFRF